MRPQSLSVAEAAALPLVALTGAEGLQWAGAPWKEPKTVLLLAGGGGTGHTGIQLAKAYGAARVITTCEPEQAALLKELGADQTIDYHTANWYDVLQPGTVDVIYDCVALAGSGEHAYDILATGHGRHRPGPAALAVRDAAQLAGE